MSNYKKIDYINERKMNEINDLLIESFVVPQQ